MAKQQQIIDIGVYIKNLAELDEDLKKISVDLHKRRKIIKATEMNAIMNRVSTIDKRANLNLKVLEKCLPSKVALTDPTGKFSYAKDVTLDTSKLTTEQLKAIKGALNVKSDE